MSDYMHKEYKLPNGRTVTADFDDVGISKVTIQAMDALFEILNSSDVVEVVRCKDCKHYNTYESHEKINDGDKLYDGWCMRWSGIEDMNDNDFFSYGERKDEGL